MTADWWRLGGGGGEGGAGGAGGAGGDLLHEEAVAEDGEDEGLQRQGERLEERREQQLRLGLAETKERGG